MGQDNQGEAGEQVDPSAMCDPKEGKHVYKQIFKCDRLNCETFMCKRCMGKEFGGARYCELCTLNEEMKEMNASDMAMPSGGGKAHGFSQSFSVNKDKTTGQIVGWDTFFQYIEEVSDKEKKLIGEFTETRQELKASYVIDRIEGNNYFIKSNNDQKMHEVKLVCKEEGKGELEGLPNHLQAFVFNFNEKDIYDAAEDVINVLITMYDSKGDGQANIVNKMPRNSQFVASLEDHAQIMTTDPSKYYDIIGKLGQGGFAKVFKVKRKKDGFICALKFVEPKNDMERQIIINEVGVMRMCADNQGVLKVVEAYDFKQRLWIFVELMDDALTSYVQTLHKSYSENIVKYVLKKSLEGLHYLHQRHIIHRDIKSDNLLMNSKGEVKLADFGYAVQLTEERAGRKSKVGTVCWMAPELIRGERQYTTKVDIWSFGIFAMEMADGDPPYIQEPQGRVIFNIVKKDPPPINKRWSNDFQDFVKKCLVKDPSQRGDAKVLLDHPFLANADQHQTEFAESVKGFLALKQSIVA